MEEFVYLGLKSQELSFLWLCLTCRFLICVNREIIDSIAERLKVKIDKDLLIKFIKEHCPPPNSRRIRKNTT
jgi:hypothetical protein